MDDLKTFEGVLPDPLYQKQKEDVAKMRASLLSCNADPSLTKVALQNITVMRIYHQIARIIKYLSLMDKLEEKLYSSIEYTIDKMNPESQSTWMMLLNIQEKLQKNMIESHKLLQPFMELQDHSFAEFASNIEEAQNPVIASNGVVMNANSREKLRLSAQEVIRQLNKVG